MKPPPCRIDGERCPTHGYAHGAEAEDLRAGLEVLIAGADDSVDPDERVVAVADLVRLLNHIDARDSLAFCERRKRKARGGS